MNGRALYKRRKYFHNFILIPFVPIFVGVTFCVQLMTWEGLYKLPRAMVSLTD